MDTGKVQLIYGNGVCGAVVSPRVFYSVLSMCMKKVISKKAV